MKPIQASLELDFVNPQGCERVLHKSATELKNDGIERAKNRADKENENWSAKAYNFFIEFAKNSKEPFMTNDVVLASVNRLPQPSNLKAWGAIPVKAKHAGLIKHVGFSGGSNPRHHSNPRSLWLYTGK